MARDGSPWAEHDAALIDWAKVKLAEVDAATRGSSALVQFLSRATAEFHAMDDADRADVGDKVLAARVQDFYATGGMFPIGRTGALYALLRPSIGDSRCRVLCKAAKDESASDPRAATIDARIQSLWDAIQAVLNSAIARAQNEPHDDSALERFCSSWDALRDYIPRPKANVSSMGALSNDNRTIEILNLLRDAPDREAGIAIAELPAQLWDEGLFTEWLAADLIEVIQRNHCHTGAGSYRELVLENGWSVTELSKPGRKQVWQLLQEALGIGTEPEIRLRVRLGRAGELEAARLRRIITPQNVDPSRPAMPAAIDKPKGDSPLAPVPFSFRGGEMVFLPHRVTLCGADICSGPRSVVRRQLLELLSQQIDNRYVAYSGEDIAFSLKLAGGAVAVAGLVRDLRDEIVASLRDQFGIDCDRHAVILSRGQGYRLAPSVSICREIPSVQGTAPRPSVDPNQDDPDHLDPDAADSDDPDPDRGDPDVPDESNGASARQAWILEQLADNRALRAPDVVSQFGCSLTTAKRTLKTLRRAGKIVFVGDARTGSYRLNQPHG